MIKVRSEEMKAKVTNLVCGNKVADEEEHDHDDVLSDGGDVGTGDLKNFNTLLGGSIEIDVIRADTSGDADLELGSLL